MKDYTQKHRKIALKQNHACKNCSPEGILERQLFQEKNHSSMTCLFCGGYYPGDCKEGPDCCCDGCNTLWRTKEQNKLFYDKLYNRVEREMNAKTLFVLDLETTGFDPVFDRILEITIYELDTENYKYKLVYNTVIKQDICQKFIQDCWVVQQGYITLEEIDHGRDQSKVKSDVLQLLEKQQVTSFNTAFDIPFIKKQLQVKDFIVPFCLMQDSTGIVQLPSYNNYSEWKWPKLQEAYGYFYNESKEEKHRSDYDTELAVQIAIALLKYKKSFILLREAMQKGQLVVINYTDKKNERTYDRRIKPTKFKRNDTLVEAFDYLRQENRTFAIGRISEIKEIE